jgi:DNA-binding transcriptional ArsR family regulator
MALKPEYRDRDDTDVAVLGTLADRPEEGMTIFELRAEVEEDIDTIEESLARLKRDHLIEANNERGQTVILPQDHALTNGTGGADEDDIADRVRDWFPF